MNKTLEEIYKGKEDWDILIKVGDELVKVGGEHWDKIKKMVVKDYHETTKDTPYIYDKNLFKRKIKN